MNLNNVREIVTRAVIAKGRKIIKLRTTLESSDDITSVLGCWIINHDFTTTLNNNVVGVLGSFEADIWYSSDNNTKTNVLRKAIDYEECIKVKEVVEDTISNNCDTLLRVLQQPTCTNALITDEGIALDIVLEVIVEVIGETKIMINVCDGVTNDESFDDFENEINEDFLSEG